MKFCECGCGQPAPIAQKTQRDKGYAKGEAKRFIHNHNHRGRKQSELAKARMRVAFGRGPDHHLWKGDEAKYGAKHQWMLKWFKKTGRCEACGCEARTEWANRDHAYRRVREDWLELCTRCHRCFDRERSVLGKGQVPA
jgi:hypothetical protein